MPNRYADAVRARRAELREWRGVLTPGHRTELRGALTLARVAVVDDAGAALDALHAELVAHIDRSATAPDPSAALAAITRRAADAWSQRAGAAARSVAAVRGAVPPADWPVVAGPVPPGPPTPPPAAARLVEVVADAGAWRLAALPLAVAPLLGFAGPALVLPALGAGALVLVTVFRARRAATDRARLRRWADAVVAAARSRLDAELVRCVVAVEQHAIAPLETALAARRAALDAELAALTPERPGALA